MLPKEYWTKGCFIFFAEGRCIYSCTAEVQYSRSDGKDMKMKVTVFQLSSGLHEFCYKHLKPFGIWSKQSKGGTKEFLTTDLCLLIELNWLFKLQHISWTKIL